MMNPPATAPDAALVPEYAAALSDDDAALAARPLGQLASTLPGATAVFRRYKLDFCCGGQVSLAAASAAKQLPLADVLGALRALDVQAAQPAPDAPAALIEHILRCYHDVHRRELPELIRLARRVEAVHRDHVEVPAGLAELLTHIAEELETHMQKEEQVLFPLMRNGGHAMFALPIARMRDEHDEHGAYLRALEALTRQTTPPDGACTTWRALYAGVRKLIDDLMEHIHLENNRLFPQFAA